jgi:hypothetical protein
MFAVKTKETIMRTELLVLQARIIFELPALPDSERAVALCNPRNIRHVIARYNLLPR